MVGLEDFNASESLFKYVLSCVSAVSLCSVTLSFHKSGQRFLSQKIAALVSGRMCFVTVSIFPGTISPLSLSKKEIVFVSITVKPVAFLNKAASTSKSAVNFPSLNAVSYTHLADSIFSLISFIIPPKPFSERAAASNWIPNASDAAAASVVGLMILLIVAFKPVITDLV